MGNRRKLDKSPAKQLVKRKASQAGGVNKSRVSLKKVIKRKRAKLKPAVKNGISELKKILKSSIVNRDEDENESSSLKAVVNGARNVAGKVRTTFRSSGSQKVKGRVRNIDPVKLNRGVVLLSHLPHGFYENEITAYFSQFGVVTNVHLPRAKSGRIKGYAFIEFQHPEVAKVAAETMDNYLMLQRLLKAKYIPPEEQKPNLFQPRQSLKDRIDRLKINMVRNENRDDNTDRKKMKILKKFSRMMRNKEKYGYKYDIEIVTDKQALLTGIKQINPET